ncbi:MAG: agmatinase [Planctomycetota bacterium]
MSDDRATRLPDSRVQPRFAGVCSFGRWPVLGEDGPCDWAVLGVPFDGGVTYRPGCRFGPRAIREQSQYLKHYSIEHSIDVPGSLRLADAGDAPVRPFDVEQTLTSVRVHAASLADRAERLLMLGGDHSIAFAGMMHAWERSGRPAGGLACIHFDSHLDTIDTVWGEQWNHATPFRRLIEAGALDPKRMISLGIKGPLNSADDLEYARDHGIEILGHDASLARGPDRLREFVSRLAGGPVYLSFDIDCIDPAYAPGTGTPCVGGFTSAEALMLIRACAGANIVGADVVEVLPDRDVAGNTALLAAHVAFEILACDAVRRRDKRDSGPA